MNHLGPHLFGEAADFLSGGSELAGLIRQKDWSATPLGPIETWPQSLRTTVSLCLASNFPINIIWGPGNTQIYNDGYKVVCGEAHPVALGQDYSVTWASAWPAVGEPFAHAQAGETSFLENQRMFLHRNGYLEETFFTFSLSPIRDETGGIGGLFHPVTETTATMLGDRRTRAVRDLTARLSEARTAAEVFRIAAGALAGFPFDLPFVLLYRLAAAADGDAAHYALAAATGFPSGMTASPERIGADAAVPWPMAELVASQAPMVVRGLADLLGAAPCGPYEEAPDRAVAIPISLPGGERPTAIMIAGASSRLPFDDEYRGFYDLLAAALGAALANAHAYEEERRRAEALAAIDRAKTLFFSNVSHEFRTPLTLMLGPIEDAMAEAATLPPTQRQRLDVAHRNARRLLKLVNSLLDFSRIEAGRAQARFEPVDLGRLTTDLASNFRSACERAGLDLTVDCPPLGRPVYVDRDMWETVVLNLLSNAFKFTLQGGITVSLRKAGHAAELAVKDTGVGIPAAELPRIFERFHRIEGQSGRTHEGTGIGLAFVRELVALHGGMVWADSTPGQGATFRVSIPLGTAHLPLDRIAGQQALPTTAVHAGSYVEEALRWLPDREEETAPASGIEIAAVEGRPRIVLADDNADMRAYIAGILAQGGYEVDAVANGAAALASVRRDVPDLLLTDVMMPDLDGFGLLREVRSVPDLKGLLVILLSARAGEEARIEGLAAGADDYLVKPFSARELRARVDGAVSLARQRREAAVRERNLRAEIATERGRAALRESEERLAFALKAGGLGSWELDLRSQRLTASEICRANLGMAASEPLKTYDDLLRRIHPDDRQRQGREVAQAIEAHSPLDIEYRILRPDGEVTWIEVRGRAVYDEHGSPLRIVGVSLDVTERKRAEARQKLLLDELNHRVKNTLASVQSIVMQTQRSALSPEAFNRDLNARIAALARAHDLLTRASWEGASLSDVVDQTLALHMTDANGTRRVEVHAPQIRLSPNAAVSLNMAVHELAMNAAKYGALSAPEGRVLVNWIVEDVDGHRIIRLSWCEKDGPTVHPPERRGFGSRLLEHGIARELDGEVRLDFAPSGVCCEMRLPVSAKMMPVGGKVR